MPCVAVTVAVPSTDGVGQVVSASDDHIPNSAARVWDVTGEAWDDVDVEMVDGLAGRRTSVEADVEAVGLVQLIDLGLNDVNELEDVGSLTRSCFPPVAELSTRNDECVSRRHRIVIPDGEC